MQTGTLAVLPQAGVKGMTDKFKVKVYQAMPIKHVLCMEDARGIWWSGRRGREENLCDFKPIQVSLRLHNSSFQPLDLPPTLLKTLEMPGLRGPMIHFHHSAFERSIKGELVKRHNYPQLHFTKNSPRCL